jgi:hypothetical protein
MDASKVELDGGNRTDFQMKLHSPENGMMESYYLNEPITCPFSSKGPEKLESFPDDDRIVYKVNENYSLLCETLLGFNLPDVRVKKEFEDTVRVAWPKRIGHAVVLSAECRDDQITYHEFDRVWLDKFSMFFQPPGEGKREHYNEAIGNIKSLTRFSTHLHAHPVYFSQPWFYHILGEKAAFPLYAKKPGTTIGLRHTYKFNRVIKDLLIVEMWVNGEWATVPSNDIKQYLEPLGNKIKPPNLYGKYRLMTSEEIEYILSNCKNGGEDFVCTRYIPAIISIDVVVKGSPTDTTVIQALGIVSPCTAIFCAAENMVAYLRNNYSNYTNNERDSKLGRTPITSIDMSHSVVKKFGDLPIEFFTIGEAGSDSFPSAPYEKGFCAYAISQTPISFDPDPGLTFTPLKTQLTCILRTENQDYTLRIRCLVTKKLTITAKTDGANRVFVYEVK